MILSFLTSCTIQKTKGISLEQALSMSGENREELEKVLEYYKNRQLKAGSSPIFDPEHAVSFFTDGTFRIARR